MKRKATLLVFGKHKWNRAKTSSFSEVLTQSCSKLRHFSILKCWSCYGRAIVNPFSFLNTFSSSKYTSHLISYFPHIIFIYYKNIQIYCINIFLNLNNKIHTGFWNKEALAESRFAIKPLFINRVLRTGICCHVPQN